MTADEPHCWLRQLPVLKLINVFAAELMLSQDQAATGPTKYTDMNTLFLYCITQYM